MSARILTAIHVDGGSIILTVGMCEVTLTPALARRLARVLHRTAREAERREDQAMADGGVR
jgi:hypothetical protein